MIDCDIHLARALLVDNNVLLRSVGAEHLRNAGVGQVVQVARIQEARLLIEREAFDIIVCNREFEGNDDSGQDLLDELRRENLLPHRTVFLMVTSQAAYHQVVEAAEAALDVLLLRPYSGASLNQRLAEARHRKRELGDILQAMDSGQTELALTLALQRFQNKLPYATYCGRLVAELLLTMQRPADARMVFEKLAQPAGATWARLGVARSLLASGEVRLARDVIGSVLADDGESADAHDLLGGLLVEQCDFEGAMAEYGKAAAITPGCLLRNQHAGALAFYLGRSAPARARLEIAVALGVQSKLFDALTLMLIAVLRHDDGDGPGMASTGDQLRRYAARHPGSRRLLRFQMAVDVLAELLAARPVQALKAVRGLSQEVAEDDFDLEAANTALLLWDRLPPTHRPAGEHVALVERIGMRFCVSNAATEVLVASARRAAPAAEILRACHGRVATVAEQAMEAALRGQAKAAVLMLLEMGEQSGNAKLLEMAVLLARRNESSLPEADALAARAAAALARSCRTLDPIAGIRRSGRAPGGLPLRRRAEARPEAALTLAEQGQVQGGLVPQA